MTSAAEIDLLPAAIDGIWGYVGQDGNWRITPRFDSECSYFEQGRASAVPVGEGKYIVIDRNGNKISDVFIRFTDGLALRSATPLEELRAGARDIFGYIDEYGVWVIEPQFYIPWEGGSYTEKYNFSEGLAIMHYEGKYGFINRQGEWQIPACFDDALPFSEGVAAVRIDGKWGFIDQDGQYVIEPQYSGARRFSESMAAVGTDVLWGFIDHQNQWVIQPELLSLTFYERYDELVFIEGYAIVRVKPPEEGRLHLFGYIDKDGNWAIPPQFTTAMPFLDGVAAVMIEEAERLIRGYIDTDGEFIIQWRVR